MLTVTVTGQAEMRRVADRMRRADRDLDRDLTSGIRKAVKPLGAAIKKAVPVYTPSGYTPVLAGSIQTTTSVRRVRAAGVSIKVFAPGKVKNRDVKAIAEGRLKHPLFGDRKRWYTTTVKAGLGKDQLHEMRDPILHEMKLVVDAHLERIANA